MRIAVCPGEVRPVAITGTSLPLSISRKDPCLVTLPSGRGRSREVYLLPEVIQQVSDSHSPSQEGF